MTNPLSATGHATPDTLGLMFTDNTIAIPAFHLPLSSIRRLVSLLAAHGCFLLRDPDRRALLLEALGSPEVIQREMADTIDEIKRLSADERASRRYAEHLAFLRQHWHRLINLQAHVRQFGTVRATHYLIPDALNTAT